MLHFFIIVDIADTSDNWFLGSVCQVAVLLDVEEIAGCSNSPYSQTVTVCWKVYGNSHLVGLVRPEK